MTDPTIVTLNPLSRHSYNICSLVRLFLDCNGEFAIKAYANDVLTST